MTVAYHNTCKRYPFFFILSSILLKNPGALQAAPGLLFSPCIICASDFPWHSLASLVRTLHWGDFFLISLLCTYHSILLRRVTF